MNRLKALLFLKFASPKASFATLVSLAIVGLLFFSVPVPANAMGILPGCDINIPCWIGEGLIGLGGLFVQVAGMVLDFVLNSFVFNMKGTLTPGGPETFDFSMYKDLWVIVRDLANLTFIFILLYAAITTILQVQKENLGKIAARLIVVAILMNFSLFFVQVGIDLSNYTSLQIFKNVEVVNTNNEVIIGEGTASLSTAIQNVLRTTAVANQSFSKDNMFVMGVMSFIFLTTAAGVMLAGAIMFFIRFFMLLIYMILSPVALAAVILPRFEEHFHKWREGLIKQLLFAPAYFLLIYLSLKFLQEIRLDTTGSSNPWEIWARIFIAFGVATAFLVYSLIAASKIGATGASAISSKSKDIGKWTVNKAAGASGWAARNTLGRGANALREGAAGTHLSRMAVSDSVVARRLGRLGLGTLDKTRDANFDVRNTAIGKKAGLKGEKRGFKKIDDAKKKERAERTKAYLKDAVKLTDKEKKYRDEAKKRLSGYNDQITALEEQGTNVAEQIQKHEEAEQNIQEITTKEQQEQARLSDLTTKLHDQFGVGLEQDIEAKKTEILALQKEVGERPMNEIESLRHEQKIRTAQSELKTLEDRAQNSLAKKATQIDAKQAEITRLQAEGDPSQPANPKIAQLQQELEQLNAGVDQDELQEYRQTTQQAQTVEQQMINLQSRRQDAQTRLVENIDELRTNRDTIKTQVQDIKQQKQSDSLVADLENQVKTLYEAKVTDMKGPGGEFWRRATLQPWRPKTVYGARIQKRKEHQNRIKDAKKDIYQELTYRAAETEAQKAAQVTTASALNIGPEVGKDGQVKTTINPERGVGDSYYKEVVKERNKKESDLEKFSKQMKALQDKMDKQNNDETA